MRTIAFAALALASGLLACQQKQDQGPILLAQALYKPYVEGGDVTHTLEQPVYSASLREALDRAATYSRWLDEPVLDYDPLTGAQDFKVTDLKLTQQSAKRDATEVRAHFLNYGKPADVFLDMKREGEAWKIDDIRSGGESVREIIADAVKPAGDPTAMTAPVKAIYDRYGPKRDPAKPVEPIHRWAALSAGFAPIMTMRAAQAKRSDHDPLEFDPVVDGQDWQISDLRLEPAGSAVIARFQNGPAKKTLVYDLVEEDNAWKIDNIRAPGVWDVRMKLAELGIK
jgi:hypothetical protein